MDTSGHTKRCIVSARWIPVLLACGLLCGATVAVRGAEPLIERGASGWRYCDAPAMFAEQWTDPGWTAVEFDDKAWPEGQAILGYGDQDVRTELSFGNHPQHKELSALFRRRFLVTGRHRFRLLRGRLCCDDGAVVVLNGREVFRHNMPAGKVNCSTRAVRAIGPDLQTERQYHPFSVASDLLVEGENLVAVSVHQANATSSDLAMDLELTGLTEESEVTSFQDELKKHVEQTGEVAEDGEQPEPVVRFKISGD